MRSRRPGRGMMISALAALASTSAYAQEVDAENVAIAPHGFRPQWISPATKGPQARRLTEVATDDLFASVGRGYDPVTNTILDIKCVEPVPNTEVPLKGAAPEADYNTINDVKSHAAVSGSSFSAGAIIKAVSLGFGTSNTQGNYFNQVDSFVRLYVRAPTEGVDWPDVRWHKDALELVKSDMPEFIRQCGTRYVRAVYSGHMLDATVRFELHSDKRTIADASSVSLGVEKIFGVSGGNTAAETTVAEKSTARVWSKGRGVLALPPALQAAAIAGAAGGAAAPAPAPAAPAPGQPNPEPPAPPNPPEPGSPAPPGGLKVLFDWYNTGFRAAVEKAAAEKKNALPLYIRVDDYRSKFRLEHRNRIPQLLEEMATVVAATADQYANLVTIISTADYAVQTVPNNSVFFVEDGKVLGETAKKARKIFAKYSDALEYCKSLAIAGSALLSDGRTKATDACQLKLSDALEMMSDLVITRKTQ